MLRCCGGGDGNAGSCVLKKSCKGPPAHHYGWLPLWPRGIGYRPVSLLLYPLPLRLHSFSSGALSFFRCPFYCDGEQPSRLFSSPEAVVLRRGPLCRLFSDGQTMVLRCPSAALQKCRN